MTDSTDHLVCSKCGRQERRLIRWRLPCNAHDEARGTYCDGHLMRPGHPEDLEEEKTS